MPALSFLVLIAFGVNAVIPIAAEDRAGEPSQTPGEAAAHPGSASHSPEQIGRWIGELSADSYTVRQSAAKQLLDAGMDARQPLLELAEGPDPETRAAARRLVALIDRSEFHRRLAAFAADTDGKQGLTLPGWEQFRKLVGADQVARALFVEMQRQEGPMLSAAFGVAREFRDQLWEDRLLRLIQWQATVGNRSVAPPLGSCASMLFLGSSAKLEVSDRGAMLLENLIQQPPIREALQSGNHRDAVRRLVVAWILHCPNPNEVILVRRLNLASLYALEEALPLALAVAGGDSKYVRVQPSTRAAALLVVGQLGKREHADDLEPLLEDAAVCMPLQPVQLQAQQAANVQVRDVALVVMVHLTGGRPADFGYLHARLQPQRTFQLQTLFVENDEQRAKALAQWRQNKSRESRVESREPEISADDNAPVNRVDKAR